MLRIYDPSGIASAVRVQIRDVAQPIVHADFVVLLQSGSPGEPTLVPAYTAIPLTKELIPTLGLVTVIRIESIEDHPLWAFATITENATNHVDLVLPQ